MVSTILKWFLRLSWSKLFSCLVTLHFLDHVLVENHVVDVLLFVLELLQESVYLLITLLPQKLLFDEELLVPREKVLEGEDFVVVFAILPAQGMESLHPFPILLFLSLESLAQLLVLFLKPLLHVNVGL